MVIHSDGYRASLSRTEFENGQLDKVNNNFYYTYQASDLISLHESFVAVTNHMMYVYVSMYIIAISSLGMHY